MSPGEDDGAGLVFEVGRMLRLERWVAGFADRVVLGDFAGADRLARMAFAMAPLQGNDQEEEEAI